MGKKGRIKKGDYVWVRDDDLLYTPAKVLAAFKRGTQGEVEGVETGKVRI